MGSPVPTISPIGRSLSLSPATSSLPHVPTLPRQGDYGYVGAVSVPPHLRTGMPQASPRSSPTLASQPYRHPGNTQVRPTITSHPAAYGPPPILEPPTAASQAAQSGSVHGSPHTASVGWQSPHHHQALASPTSADGYVYPEPAYSVPNPAMYYQNSAIRRHQSAEPDHFSPHHRMASEMWATPVQGS